MEDFKLTIISPLKPADFPSEDVIIAAGKRILDSTKSWKQGKTYHGVVKTFSHSKGPGDGGGWYCRLSEHEPEQASFDQMWEKLGENNAMSELEFIPDLKAANKVKDISPTASIWSFTYKLPPPFSPRVYTVLQVVRLEDTSPRSGIIVSVPVDLSSPSDAELAKLEGKGVKGRYVVIERVMETESGNTEWRMATTGTAGGNLPQAFVERAMASKVSNDVPNFMRWLHGSSK